MCTPDLAVKECQPNAFFVRRQMRPRDPSLRSADASTCQSAPTRDNRRPCSAGDKIDSPGSPPVLAANTLTGKKVPVQNDFLSPFSFLPEMCPPPNAAGHFYRLSLFGSVLIVSPSAAETDRKVFSCWAGYLIPFSARLLLRVLFASITPSPPLPIYSFPLAWSERFFGSFAGLPSFPLEINFGD